MTPLTRAQAKEHERVLRLLGVDPNVDANGVRKLGVLIDGRYMLHMSNLIGAPFDPVQSALSDRRFAPRYRCPCGRVACLVRFPVQDDPDLVERAA